MITISRKFLHKLSKLRLDFHRVPRCDIAIVDSDTSEFLSSYFPNKKILVFEFDSGSRFFWPLLLCVIRGRYRIDDYIAQVINQSRATLALSFQDNFIPLLKVQEKLNNALFVLIQNGHRTNLGDLFDPIHKVMRRNTKVGYFMCFNKSICSKIEETVHANTLIIGSFRSNHVPKQSTRTRRLSYISTYHPDVPSDFVYVGRALESPISYQDVLMYRIRILRTVADFCTDNDLELVILGKRSDESAEIEKQFYRRHLQGINFIYSARVSTESNYQLCDTSWITVSTSSTLGYESVARGNRTAIFQSDCNLLQDESLKIGWPAQLAPEGPFWSTSTSSERIYQVLTLLNSVTDSEWGNLRNEMVDAMPDFDPGNLRFVESLRLFGAKPILDLVK